jgi:glyoxylase-like metal-dependent hydrolase (beta-lactamase superfamily II)
MRVHHIQCGTMCPVAGSFISGGDRTIFERALLVCHCLVIETDRGLVLVDTGYGLADCRDPSRLGPVHHLLSAKLDVEETARRRIEALDLDPDDVTHIVLTHMDLDHAGGLSDFPRAKVHVMRPEHAAATGPGIRERVRYRQVQWAHEPDFELYDVDGGEFFDFVAVRELRGLGPEILLVPLHGHSRGHAGVAVDTGEGWLLHAGDAYFYHGEIDPKRPRCTPGLRIFQRIVAIDDAQRLHNQERLRELVRKHGDHVRIFSAHDPRELDEMQAAAPTPRAGKEREGPRR